MRFFDPFGLIGACYHGDSEGNVYNCLEIGIMEEKLAGLTKCVTTTGIRDSSLEANKCYTGDFEYVIFYYYCCLATMQTTKPLK